MAADDPRGPNGRRGPPVGVPAVGDGPTRRQGRKVVGVVVPQATVLRRGLEGAASVPDEVARPVQALAVGPQGAGLVLHLLPLGAEARVDDEGPTATVVLAHVPDEAVACLEGLEGAAPIPATLDEATRPA